ncbi:MAG: hypothetical protein K8T90_14415 [Planctomycetes bacterium]|nr:hypothetical protein [Planctomycetota bacterium]
MDANDHRRAMHTLQKVYEDLARRAIESVLENEEGLRSSPYSFAYQEIEDRFAPRLVSLGHLIGSLQHLQRQRQPQTEYRVERIEGPVAELDTKINERLKQCQGETLHQVSLVPAEAVGMWHAFLTMSRTV